MKKSAPKHASPKVRHTKSAHPHAKKLLLTLAAILLLLFILPATRQPMANLLAQTGLFKGNATVTWQKVEGAKSYNIYYKRVGSHIGDNYNNAVRNIPADQTSYTISGLKKGKTYEYKISAINENGEEFMWTTFQPTATAQ
jgi:hypothetical protein